MSIFDRLKQSAVDAATTATTAIGNKRETFTFTALPESLAQMQALPEAALDTPFQTAALTVPALPPTTVTHPPSPIPSGWKATMFPVRSRAI